MQNRTALPLKLGDAVLFAIKLSLTDIVAKVNQKFKL